MSLGLLTSLATQMACYGEADLIIKTGQPSKDAGHTPDTDPDASCDGGPDGGTPNRDGGGNGSLDGGNTPDSGTPDGGLPDGGSDGGTTPTTCSPISWMRPAIDPRDGKWHLFDECSVRQYLLGLNVHEPFYDCWQTAPGTSKEAAWAKTKEYIDRAKFLGANTLRLPTETSYGVGWFLTAAEAADPTKVQLYNDKMWLVRQYLNYAQYTKGMRVWITPWDVASLEANGADGVPTPDTDAHLKAMVRLTYDDPVGYDPFNEAKYVVTDTTVLAQRWQRIVRAIHIIRQEEDKIAQERGQPVKRHLVSFPGLHWWSRDANYLLTLAVPVPSHLDPNVMDPYAVAGIHPYSPRVFWDGRRLLEEHLQIATRMATIASEVGADQNDMQLDDFKEFGRLVGGQGPWTPDAGPLPDGGVSNRVIDGIFMFSNIRKPGCHPAMYEDTAPGTFTPTAWGQLAECFLAGTCNMLTGLDQEINPLPLETLWMRHGPSELADYRLLDQFERPIEGTNTRPDSKNCPIDTYYMFHRPAEGSDHILVDQNGRPVTTTTPTQKNSVPCPPPAPATLRL